MAWRTRVLQVTVLLAQREAYATTAIFNMVWRTQMVVFPRLKLALGVLTSVEQLVLVARPP